MLSTVVFLLLIFLARFVEGMETHVQFAAKVVLLSSLAAIVLGMGAARVAPAASFWGGAVVAVGVGLTLGSVIAFAFLAA